MIITAARRRGRTIHLTGQFSASEERMILDLAAADWRLRDGTRIALVVTSAPAATDQESRQPDAAQAETAPERPPLLADIDAPGDGTELDARDLGY